MARLANNALLLASDGEDLSTVDFIRIVAKYMGRNVTLIPVPELVVDVLRKRKKASKRIGYDPAAQTLRLWKTLLGALTED